MYELLVVNGTDVYAPVVESGVKLTSERICSPSQLTFSFVDDGDMKITEGNIVKFSKDGVLMFYGYVFSISSDKDKVKKVIAYDQIRYLKNKDTYVFSNVTATEIVKNIATNFLLNVGTLTDTKFKIASQVEDNTELIDMIGNALDTTLMNTKELYVLYDSGGMLNLKNINDMTLDLLIDEETTSNYSYSTSIDSGTYNQVKLTYDNEKTGKREVYMTKDSSNISKWGVLQYYDKLKEGENGQAKADALLKLYNAKVKSLTLKDCFGDPRVRGGSMVGVNLAIEDVSVLSQMIVESVTHKFDGTLHTMDVKLKGGVING